MEQAVQSDSHLVFLSIAVHQSNSEDPLKALSLQVCRLIIDFLLYLHDFFNYIKICGDFGPILGNNILQQELADCFSQGFVSELDMRNCFCILLGLEFVLQDQLHKVSIDHKSQGLVRKDELLIELHFLGIRVSLIFE